MRTLASLGLVETDPACVERSYSGPGFIGSFEEIPSIADPMVLNVFVTAWCPLRCVYCHADDLMTQDLRTRESDADLGRIISTAKLIPSMVVVLTGGDPLTRPGRTRRVLDELSADRPIVLDTSGVGSLDDLMPGLVERDVHVRVSLDSAVPAQNRKVRPANLSVVSDRGASWEGALHTIERCVENGLAVSVQTVVSKLNGNRSELESLHRLLVDRGVRTWTMHVAVAGGAARQRELKRPGSVLPGKIESYLPGFLSDVEEDGRVEVRCTDTDRRPNSVFLVGSDGNLYTEGYAKNGKVELYSIDAARPDTVRALWHFVDHFGHAARYLNWVPWRNRGRTLEALCVKMVSGRGGDADSVRTVGVETEVKLRVSDITRLEGLLDAAGLNGDDEATVERDEYYDNAQGSLRTAEYVVRSRAVGGGCVLSLKGPKTTLSTGSYSRVEIEAPTAGVVQTREALLAQGYVRTWYLEKRRRYFRRATEDGFLVIDELPLLGYFVEIEGTEGFIRRMRDAIASACGPPESRNYQELVAAELARLGLPEDGAEFGA